MRVESVLYTLETSRGSFELPSGASFVFRQDSDESRAHVDAKYLEDLNVEQADVFAIISESADSFTYLPPGLVTGVQVDLHEPSEITAFLESLHDTWFLDITGLNHRTWAPILKASLSTRRPPVVLYVEPLKYSENEQPAAGKLFNLSDSVEGVKPLPGFARLSDAEGVVPAFVPLLGFEGPRFAFVMDQTEVDLVNTHPIIGMPGYRPEYLSYAFKGNRDQLELEFMYTRVNYAKANCPFDAFLALVEIDEVTGFKAMKVAPIGTKPHGLGAILFALARGERIEIIYDHPVRSKSRTEGEARLCVYNVPSFVESEVFLRGHVEPKS